MSCAQLPVSSTTRLSVCPSHSVSPSDSSLDSSPGFQMSCQLRLSLPFLLCCRDFWPLAFGVFPSLMHSYAHRHSLLPTKSARLPWISCMPSSGQVGLPAAAQAYFVLSAFTLSPPLARFFLPSFEPWFGASSHLKPLLILLCGTNLSFTGVSCTSLFRSFTSYHTLPPRAAMWLVIYRCRVL